MRKRILAALCAGAALLAIAVAPAGAASVVYSQGFETDDFDWANFGPGTLHREMSGFTNSGGYANGIASADGNWHARLRTNGCTTSCSGPLTRWGKGASSGNPVFPAGGYSTELDVYLDVAWAASNADRRFDFSSAINNNIGAGTYLRDFAFNAGTVGGNWVIGASTNSGRANTFPSNLCPSPSTPPNVCRAPATITTSGWYTLKHVFTDQAGMLRVDMSILDAGGATVAAWTVYSGDSMAVVGGDRYGWFANQEVNDLAIDNAVKTLLVTPSNPPTSKDDCKQDGWMTRTDDDGVPFKNQGDCVSYFATGGKNKAGN